MSLVDFLLAPREDARGWQTPNEASRIFLIIVLISVSLWAWPISEGRIVIWIGIVLFFSTPLLTVGWYILSILAKNRAPRKLISSVNLADD
tara:strand:- start:171 stop:443 length:273 start_codon:yes stop_codon:yes gene_type:complete